MGGSGFTATFHGVRGSTPCQNDSIRRYGGNTSCVSLAVPGENPLLFDLGTGLRYFGLSRPPGQPFVGTCLLSHLHWDHIQGLPFFGPMLHEGSHLTIYAPVQLDDDSVPAIFARTVRPPLFPIDLTEFAGRVDFHEVEDDEFEVGSMQVMSRIVPHVGQALGYRVTWRGSTVVYISDHQQPYDGSLHASAGVLDLCRGADLLIHDAQYTLAEFAMKRNWGHCTVDYAIWLAAVSGVRRLALFHHDPSRNDDEIDELAVVAEECGRLSGIEVFAAAERTSVAIDE